MATQQYGPLGEDKPLGPSEYDDDDLGWAGRGDLGQPKGRVLTGGERGALFRHEANADLPEDD